MDRVALYLRHKYERAQQVTSISRCVLTHSQVTNDGDHLVPASRRVGTMQRRFDHMALLNARKHRRMRQEVQRDS